MDECVRMEMMYSNNNSQNSLPVLQSVDESGAISIDMERCNQTNVTYAMDGHSQTRLTQNQYEGNSAFPQVIYNRGATGIGGNDWTQTPAVPSAMNDRAAATCIDFSYSARNSVSAIDSPGGKATGMYSYNQEKSQSAFDKCGHIGIEMGSVNPRLSFTHQGEKDGYVNTNYSATNNQGYMLPNQMDYYEETRIDLGTAMFSNTEDGRKFGARDSIKHNINSLPRKDNQEDSIKVDMSGLAENTQLTSSVKEPLEHGMNTNVSKSKWGSFVHSTSTLLKGSRNSNLEANPAVSFDEEAPLCRCSGTISHGTVFFVENEIVPPAPSSSRCSRNLAVEE